MAYDRSGQGPLLLAIHGITEDRRFWDPVPLSARFDVIRVDLRGHGESPTSGPFDPDTSAEDIHRLLVDQSFDVHPLPASVADTVREGDIETFVRSLSAGMYGDLDQAIVADLERRRTVRRDVLVGNWSPLLDLDEPALGDWVTRRTTLPADLPYLSLHGRDPGPGYDRWLQERIPTAVIERTAARTHYPHLAQPHALVERLEAFAATLP